MRILFISPRYHPHVGGVEYVVKSVAERLVRRGHEVHVLCGEQGIEKPVEEVVNKILVTRWPVHAPKGAYLIPKMRSALRKWLAGTVKDSDVIHFHSVHSVLTGFSLHELKNTTVHKVLTPYYHGTGHTLFRSILWRGWRQVVKKLLSSVNIVHTVSKLEAQLVRRDFKVDAIPIENGVDEWILSLRWSPSGYVMYSGRIEKYKNIHRLANVIKILNTDYGYDFELRIYGSGPFTDSLISYLKKIGIKYSMNPPQPFEKYVEALSKASLFGLLSEKESYPQSVNEANAIGVPVVVAQPWGVNFSERSRTLIINLDDSDDQIAKEVAEFLENAKSQQRPQVPGWEKVVEDYVKRLYRL